MSCEEEIAAVSNYCRRTTYEVEWP